MTITTIELKEAIQTILERAESVLAYVETGESFDVDVLVNKLARELDYMKDIAGLVNVSLDDPSSEDLDDPSSEDIYRTATDILCMDDKRPALKQRAIAFCDRYNHLFVTVVSGDNQSISTEEILKSM